MEDLVNRCLAVEAGLPSFEVVGNAGLGPDDPDTGIGISPEKQARLFTEFFRGSLQDTPVADAPGTGLGLSIVKRVAGAHGGRVSVESEPGRGSTFVLELPIA